MKNIIHSILILMLGCATLIHLNAQPTSPSYLVELNQEEQDAVNALVLYPKETRDLILRASKHPEALIRMQSIQSKASEAFNALLQDYPQNTQATIWDLTRYPNLIERLSSSESLDAILSDYPEVVHPRIQEAVSQYPESINAVHELNMAAMNSFEATWKNYSPEDQQAMRALMEIPEVLSILTDHIRLTIVVGDLYANNPDWLMQKADSLHLVVAREQAQEIENWKQSIKENPSALEELKASAEAYETENASPIEEYYAYDDDDYFETVEDDLYFTEEVEEERIVHHYYHYHFPYWLGYPSWYDYPRWRPYPMIWDWGFYWSPRRSFVVFNLPSFHFTNWYFYHPHHHYHYPHLSAHFVNHYYGHRGYGSSITTSVNTWAVRNQNVISQDWLVSDKQLPNRFKAYGKAEMDRATFNKKNPRKALTQKEYIERNKKQYPDLNKSVRKSKVQQPSVRKKPNTTVPRKPSVKKPSTKKPSVVIPKKQIPKVRKPLTKKPTIKKPSTKRAKDYHRNTWEKSRKNTVPKVRTPKTRKPTIKKPKQSPKVRKPKKPNGND